MTIMDDAPQVPRRVWRSLARLFAPHRAGVFWSVAFAVLAAGLSMVTAMINRALVDQFADAEDVWRLASWWGLLLVGATALSSASTWVTFRIGWAVAARLANRVFERLIHHSLAYHDRNGVGAAHTLLGRCVQEVGASFSVGFSVVIGWITLGIGGLLGLAAINPRWVLAATPLLAIAWASSWWLGRRQRRIVTQLIELELRRTEITDQVFDERLFRVVKRNALEPRFVAAFAEATLEHERVTRERTPNFSIYTQMVATAPLLALPVAWVAGRAGGASVGEVVACGALLSQVVMGGTRGAMWWLELAGAWPYVRRALAVLEEPVEDDRRIDRSIRPDDLSGRPLVLDDLHCRLGDRHVLRGITLVIAPGSYTAIVGPNGAGKTTLLRVITGLIKPDGDGVAARIGAIPIARVPREVLAGHVRAVDSAPVTFASASVLFRGSVRENIALFKPDASWAEVARAAQTAQIAYSLDRPAGRLSDGETVQMLVAQATLTRPEILVLDEGLKHVHPPTRARLRAALRRDLPGALIVEVIHEGAVTSRSVDRIVALDDGVIAEHGTHDDLMRRGGSYARWVAESTG